MKLPGQVAFGTMHGKAAAVEPPLSRLGIRLVVPEGLDTDRFGTFTGEVPRAGTMIEAARAKARAAAEATGLPVGLASEGAYGAHPLVPFLPYGRELLLWLEPDTGHEITEWLADEAPVHDHALARDLTEAEAFLAAVGFPATALVVAPAGVSGQTVAKGVADRDCLTRALTRARSLSPEGRALLQTDMRACFNPRRMGTIGRLAERLAARLASPCPACEAPGWGLLREVAGLPCRECGAPTLLPRARVLGCTACGHEVERMPEGGPVDADPSLCPLCNP